MWSNTLNSGVIKAIVDLGTGLIKIVDKLGLINTLVFGVMTYLSTIKKDKLDFASILGIHDIDKGLVFGKEGLSGQIVKRFKNKFGKQQSNKTENALDDETSAIIAKRDELYKAIESDSQDDMLKLIEVDTASIDDEVAIVENKLKEAQQNFANAQAEPMTYKVKGGLRTNKDRNKHIADASKEISDIEKELDVLQKKKADTVRYAAQFDLAEMNQSISKMGQATQATSEYFDIFNNGLQNGTEKLILNKDNMSLLSTELDKLKNMDNSGVINYMSSLGDLGDETGNTSRILAGYASTVKDGNYTIQGAQEYVKQYNQSLKQMSKEATIAQFKQNMLNLAISAATMLLSALITNWINSAARAQDEFDKLSSQLSSTKSELNSINSELDDTKSKIKELQSQGSLSFVEQEELDRLKAQNDELEMQKDLKESIQKQQQKGVNSATVKAANDYYKNTGVNSGKTTGKIAGQGAQYGAMAGGAIAAAGGATAISTSITTALAAAGTTVAPGVGTLIGILAGLVITGVGAAVGAGIGAGIGAAEEKVGESMDNMREQYAKLQEEYNAAQSQYATKSSDDNYKKMQEAQEKLTEYESMMANHLSEMNSYYSQIDLSVYDPIEDAEEIKKLRNEMNDFYDTQDKWLIQSGNKDAKNNAITRIFGQNASDELKNVKKEIELAAQDAVKIAKETGKELEFDVDLSDYMNAADLDALASRLYEMGIYIYEVENYFKDMAKAEQEAAEVSLYGVATDIDKITEGLENLKSAFDEVLESGSVTTKTLIALNEVLGTLGDSWDNYVNTMFSGVSSTQEMQKATEELAKAFIDSKILTGDAITEFERMTYIIQLRNLGVTNAEKYVDDKIAENAYKAIQNSATYNEDELKKNFGNLDDKQKEELGFKDKSFDELSSDELAKIAEYYNMSKEINAETAQEIADEYGVEIDNIDSVVSALQQRIDKEKELNDLKNKTDKGKEIQDELNKIKEVEEYYDFVSNKYTMFTWSKGSPDNWLSAEESYNKHKEEITKQGYSKEEFIQDYNAYKALIENMGAPLEDLLERKTELQAQLDDLNLNPEVDQAEIDRIEDEIKNIDKKIETELTADVKLKLELQNKSDLVDQMQDVYDTLADAEKEYNENGGYVSVDTLQSLLKLEPKYLSMLYDENGQLNMNKTTVLEVAKARTLDMGIQAAQNAITAASEALEAGKIETLKQLTDVTYNQADANWALVQSNLAALKTQIELANTDPTNAMYGKLDGVYDGVYSQVNSIYKLTNQSVKNIENSFSTSSNTAKATAEDAFQKAMDYWENRIGANQSKYEQIQNEIDLLEKKGKIAGEGYYQAQIDLENERWALLTAQKTEAESMLKSFKRGSDEWWNVANTLNDIEGELDDVTASIQDLSDAMAEVNWKIFDETHERFGNLIDDLDTIRELIASNGEEDWFDDEGMWTEKGVASLATYIQQLHIYENALDDVEKKLADDYSLPFAGNESHYKKLGIDSEQELYDAREKLKDQQYEYAKAISDTEQSVVDMYESQIDAVEEYTSELIDAYNDYIDVVKEALDAERDLYNFKKDIKKQTKDIASLERRIASLSGSTNASDIAERRKLEAELYEAKEGLNDTYYDHAKDAQSQALDDEAEAYEESMTSYIDTLRDKLDEAKHNMDSFMKQVTTAVTMNAGAVLTQYTNTGIAIDKALTTPWANAAQEMKGYETNALPLMNQWTKSGANGFVYNFSVDATTQLRSPWEAGANAVASFQSSTKEVMGAVVKDIQTNVSGAITELNKIKSLYAEINSTTVKSPNTPDDDDIDDGGSKYNANVANLQNLLNDVFGEKLTVDGIYGPNTIAAVKRLQNTLKGTYSSVTVNGDYDTNTSRALESYLKKMAQTAYDNDHFEDADMIAKYHRNTPSSMYAKGTMGTSRDQWALTDEIGDELVLVPGPSGNLSFMRKGTSVVPADITANLVEWGKLNPDMLNIANPTAGINMISNAVNKPEFNLSFEALVKADKIDQDTLPEVKRFVQQEINSLVKQMNYAIKKFK